MLNSTGSALYNHSPVLQGHTVKVENKQKQWRGAQLHLDVHAALCFPFNAGLKT